MRRFAIAACSALLLSPLGVQAQLRGHGGPVRALAISADGKTAISGSFDQTAIIWSLRRNAAEQVLRFHDGAVNAAVLLGDGRAATGGAPGGKSIASASWDHTVRVWPLAGGGGGGGGAPRVLEGHPQNVNGVAFLPDGRVVSAGYGAVIRIWSLALH